MTYPSGKVLSYNYGSANGTHDVISRLDSLSETNGNTTTTLESYTYLGLSTVVKVSVRWTSIFKMSFGRGSMASFWNGGMHVQGRSEA